MPKRDYKSYNVLGEELVQEETYEQNEELSLQPVRGARQEQEVNGNETIIQVIQEEKNEINNKVSLEKEKEGFEEIIDIEISRIEQTPLEKVEEVKEKVQKSLDLEYVLLNEEIEDKLNINTEKPKGENKKEHVKAIKKVIQEKAEEIEENIDMSFAAYKESYQTKERSRLVRWSVRLVKIVILLMLLPFIAILATGIISILGGFLMAIIAAIGSGLVILGAICFVSTQISSDVIALGISAAITALALGGILLILFSMLIKWMVGLFRKYRKPHKRNIRKEVR